MTFEKFLNQEVEIVLMNGQCVRGKLLQIDQYLNVLLDDMVEENIGTKTTALVKGSQILYIGAL